MGKGRPRFEQPPLRRCMWIKCPNLNMVSTDVDMCVRHAIIVSERLDNNAKMLKQRERERIAEENTMRSLDMIEEKQRAEQLSRLKSGRPQTNRLYYKVQEIWVYYVKVGDQIKIGFTTDLANRMRSYPPNAEILGIEYGGRDLERQRHDQFNAYLAYGREWFHDNQELRDHIATLPPHKQLLPKRMRRGHANSAATVKPRYWR